MLFNFQGYTKMNFFYDRGGLQLPNLEWFYWAAQIRAGMFYFERNYPPAWVSLKAHQNQNLQR